MNSEVILTCAVTGAGDSTAKNPNVPITPQQIAQSCVDAAKAGASIAHVHVRDPETGAISHKTEHFREVVDRVRARTSCSTSPPAVAATCAGAAARAVHAGLRQLQLADMVYLNTTDWLREHAALVQAAGVKPELECFDLGQVWFARQLIEEGLISGRPRFQLCLGIAWGAEADPAVLLTMCDRLPADAI